MKRIFIWLFLIVAIIGGTIAALPLLFSSDEVWAKVNPILEQQVGRTIKVAGKRELSLYPNIALVLGDVEIGSNISDETPLASLNSLRVSVDLMSLFSGKINVNELLLDGADITLIVAPNGTANWQASDTAPAPLPEQSTNEDDPLGNLIAESVNEQAQPSSSNSIAPEFNLADLSVRNFKVTNSRLTYENYQSGSFELAEDINLNISLSNQNKSLGLDGNVTWQKQPLTFSLASFEIEKLLSGQDAALDFKLNSVPVNLDLKGLLHSDENIGFVGNLALNASSLKNLGQWLSLDIASVNDSPVQLNSNVELSGSTYQLGDLSLSIFGSQINGTLNVSTAGTPNIYGKLAIDQITYVDIVPQSAPSQNSQNWSDSAIGASFLSSLNSNISLSIGQLDYDGIVSNAVNTTVIIRKSTAKLPLQLNIFGGQISSEITAQLNGNGIAINANIQATNIKAADALQSLDITDKLSATTNLNTQISTSGASLRQLMRNLNGTGNLAMGEGVIKGIAIADALAPEIANMDLSLNSPEKLAKFALEAGKSLFNKNVSDLMSNGFGQNVGADKQTHFVKATLNFDIKNGVLNNQDLEVHSENIIIRGAGTVDIGGKTLDYRIIPKLLRQTKTGSAERMTVPVLITGNWSDPTIAVDYAYAIEHSSTISNMRDKAINKITTEITEKITNKVVDKVKQEVVKKIGGALTEKIGDELTNQIGDQVGDQIGNLLGIKPKALPEPNASELPEETAPAKTPKSEAEKLLDAGNLLNNLFNAPK
ncbi:MAG: AsmA family protein [Hyphomicrobiales bacterium]